MSFSLNSQKPCHHQVYIYCKYLEILANVQIQPVPPFHPPNEFKCVMEAIRDPQVFSSLKKPIPVVPTPSNDMIDQLKEALHRRRVDIEGSSESD
jgi:hypothetical protein